MEWFSAQDPAYRDTVLPPGIRARVSVEAGITGGWEKIIGDVGRGIGVEHSGASADCQTLYRQFGITADAVPPPHATASTTPSTAPGQEATPPPLPRPPAAPPTPLART